MTYPKNRKPQNRYNWRSYEDAKKFVRSLDLKNENQWRVYCKSGKKPTDIPLTVARVYKKEWNSMGDWLGTGYVAPQKRQYRPFKEARKFAQSLNLKNRDEWNAFCKSDKKPDDIPSQPQMVYKKEWEGYGDWFGTGTIAIQVRSANYLPWPEAKIVYRRLAKKYGIKHDAQFVKFAQTHKKLFADLRIPIRPRDAYSKEMVWKKMKK